MTKLQKVFNGVVRVLVFLYVISIRSHVHFVEKESRTIGSEFGRSLSMRIGGANGEVRDSMDVVDGRGT